jgi:hypothetical protein
MHVITCKLYYTKDYMLTRFYMLYMVLQCGLFYYMLDYFTLNYMIFDAFPSIDKE